MKSRKKPTENDRRAAAFALTDADVIAAMREIEGYLDISVEDFRELYARAIRLARERFLRSTPVSAIMQTEVVAINHLAGLEALVAALAEAAVSGLPVVDDEGGLMGVVSEKDIFTRLSGESDTSFWEVLSGCLQSERCLMKSITSTRARDIMSSPAITVAADASVRDALELCRRHGINRLPVIGSDKRLVGIVTRGDILQAHLDFGEE